MRVAGGGRVVVPGRLLGALVEVVVDQRADGGGVDDVLGAGLVDGLVDGGLEALEVQHRVGLLDGGDLLGGELQVVRLDAGGGQVGDADVLAAYLRGEELHGVERRDDVQFAVRALGAAVAAAGGEGEGADHRGDGQGYDSGSASDHRHDNHSHLMWK